MSGAAHAADEPDEVTRILQAGDAIAPSGEVQAMQTARPAEAEKEERTTILLHPALDEGEDERTTILPATRDAQHGAGAAREAEDLGALAQPDPLPASGQDSSGLWHAVSVQAALGETFEPATVLATPSPEDNLAGYERAQQAHELVAETHFATPEAGPDRDVFGGIDPAHAAELADADEPTTILTSPAAADAERTATQEHEHSFPELIPADTGSGDDAPLPWAKPWPSPAQTAQPSHAQEAAQIEADRTPAFSPETNDTQEVTTILHTAEPSPGTPDSTEILPAAALAGLPDGADGVDGQVSGRAWFDRRLRDFNHALLHTQAGQRRPAAERQALAAAARDMIQRVGLRDPEHKPADWADTVLQADQLLVNTYFVRALIARGGVGEIYRARHRDLKTEHAIKILLPRYALDPTVLNLMLEEARLLQRVRHEAVVGCQGLLRDTDGRPMLVMDYLRGPTLSARLRQGPLPQADLVRLATRLASGLSALHAQGLVHQDISPDNIILVDDNCAAATIIDFGLARSLDAPENTHRNIDFAGKFSWCSPEQLSSRAAQVDARSDLYSLGLVLAAAARGARLDMGSDLSSARAARHSVPPLGGIQEPVATLLRHLLAPSTALRLRSAEEVPDWLRPKRQGFVQRIFGR